MGVHRLHHIPPQPRGALPGDVSMAGDAAAAVGGRDDARIRAELVAGPEPEDVTDLGLHQHRRVVAHPEDGGKQPYVLVTGRDAPELQGQQPDLLPEGRHQPEVAVDGLQPQAPQPLGALPGEEAVLLGRPDPLVGEGAADLDLEIGLLSDGEGPSANLLPELRDVRGRHVALGETIQPEQLRQGPGVDPIRLDAGLRDVQDLLWVGDEDVVSSYHRANVERKEEAGHQLLIVFHLDTFLNLYFIIIFIMAIDEKTAERDIQSNIDTLYENFYAIDDKLRSILDCYNKFWDIIFLYNQYIQRYIENLSDEVKRNVPKYYQNIEEKKIINQIMVYDIYSLLKSFLILTLSNNLTSSIIILRNIIERCVISHYFVVDFDFWKKYMEGEYISITGRDGIFDRLSNDQFVKGKLGVKLPSILGEKFGVFLKQKYRDFSQFVHSKASEIIDIWRILQ